MGCSAGTYNAVAGQDDHGDCKPCAAGGWCPYGSTSSQGHTYIPALHRWTFDEAAGGAELELGELAEPRAVVVPHRLRVAEGLEDRVGVEYLLGQVGDDAGAGAAVDEEVHQLLVRLLHLQEHHTNTTQQFGICPNRIIRNH